MEYEALPWALHDVVDGMTDRLLPFDVEMIREYIDHDEPGLAMDDLASVLLHGRVQLTDEEYRKVQILLTHFQGVDSRFPLLAHGDAVAAALDRVGRRPRPRDLPALRGGHLSGSERPGATEFPAGWSEARAAAAIPASSPVVVLPNDRTWREGELDGVRVGRLSDADGAPRAVVPLPGPQVQRNPVPRTPLSWLLAGHVRFTAAAVLAAREGAMDPAVVGALRALLDTGEWEELADALAAELLDRPAGLSGRALQSARELLLAFDPPVEGCPYLDARDTVLARLGQQ